MLATLGAGGVVLGAWYMLTMVRQVFFGAVKEPHHDGHGPIADLNGRELAALLPIAGCAWRWASSPSRSSIRCGPKFRWWPASPTASAQTCGHAPTGSARQPRPAGSDVSILASPRRIYGEQVT